MEESLSSGASVKRTSTRLRSKAKSPVRAVAQGTKAEVPGPARTTGAEADKHSGAEGFGGVVGCAMMVFGLPCLCLLLTVCCTPQHCMRFSSLFSDIGHSVTLMSVRLSETFQLKALLIVIAWLVFLAVLYIALPGETVEGELIQGIKVDSQGRHRQLGMANSFRLPYKLNGQLQFWLTFVILLYGNPNFDSKGSFIGMGSFPLHKIFDMVVPLVVASIIVSFALSLWFQVRSFRSSSKNAKLILSHPGSTGSWLEQFFMGRELNPRWFDSLDWKVFLDLRVGILTWNMVNLAAFMHYKQHHSSLPLPLLVVFATQFWYGLDAMIYERAILTTMDITTEGLGFMLVFGNITFVPVVYTIASRYLMHFDAQISSILTFMYLVLYVAGFIVFRLSNQQKDTFRKNPNHTDVQHLESMSTRTGRRLLTSGWWGIARKVNYTGDLMMALSYCLLCGVNSFFPYFFFVYLFMLLGHRLWRDEKACSRKYEEDWERYKSIVPYVLVPYVI